MMGSSDLKKLGRIVILLFAISCFLSLVSSADTSMPPFIPMIGWSLCGIAFLFLLCSFFSSALNLLGEIRSSNKRIRELLEERASGEAPQESDDE